MAGKLVSIAMLLLLAESTAAFEQCTAQSPDIVNLLQLKGAVKPGRQRSLARPKSGESITDFIEGAKIGEGAFGIATKVKHGGRDYVWKQPKKLSAKATKMAGGDPVDELANGANIMDRIKDCPNVCQLVAGPGEFSIGGDVKNEGYVTAFYNQGDLEHFLAEDQATLQENYQKFKSEFKAALACMHRLRIAHLDLKADNIFVDKAADEYTFHVADFDKSSQVASVAEATDADRSKYRNTKEVYKSTADCSSRNACSIM